MMGMVGASMRLFGTLARNCINVILISQASSEYSICIAVDPKSGGTARRELELEFRYEMSVGLIEAVRVMEELSVVALVGENMRQAPGVRSEEHTSELQSLMRTSYAVFCSTQKHTNHTDQNHT